MSTLRIDNVDIEMGDSKVVMTKQPYPFNDWFGRTLNRSERLQLPKTTILDQIFNRPKQPNISGQKYNFYHSFTYSSDSSVIFSGECILIKAGSSYDIQLIDSSKSLFDSMAENKIKSINLESHDFIFGTAAYNTLKTKSDSVWLWAISSMHEKSITANTPIPSGDLSYSRPFFRLSNLISESLDANKWSVELSDNCELINDLLLSSNSETFYFTSYEKQTTNGFAVSGTYNFDLSTYDFLYADSTSGDLLKLLKKTAIRFRGYLSSDSDLTLRISGTSSSGTDTQTNDYLISNGTFFYDIKTPEFDTIDTTYNITVSIVGSGNVSFTNLLIYTVIDESNLMPFSMAVLPGYKVKTYDNLPDVSQKDILKHTLVMVGGFFQTNDFRKRLIIKSLNELSRLSALDWSDKIDTDINNISGYKMSSYAQYNYFQYNNDDTKPINLGRGLFNIDDETIIDSKVIYQSEFSGSDEVLISSSNMITLPVYSDTERVAELTTIIAYVDDTGLGYTVARFADISGQKIINTYYNKYVKAIQQGLIIEVDAFLNGSDFLNFDFGNLVYIDIFKSVFFVLSIKDYSIDIKGITKLQLMKA